jgi:hypothetical protein
LERNLEEKRWAESIVGPHGTMYTMTVGNTRKLSVVTNTFKVI